MSRLSKSIVLGFQIILVGMASVAAQDKEITGSQFESYMYRARRAAKDISFRESITTETSEFPVGPWEYDSSNIREFVFPNREHGVDPDIPIREYVRIDHVAYIKEGNEPWVRRDLANPVYPSSPVTFEISFKDGECKVGSDNDRTVIRCVSRSKSIIEANRKIRNHAFSFDGTGKLVKCEAIVFNSRNWSRTIWLFDYDPSIRIDAPIN